MWNRRSFLLFWGQAAGQGKRDIGGVPGYRGGVFGHRDRVSADSSPAYSGAVSRIVSPVPAGGSGATREAESGSAPGLNETDASPPEPPPASPRHRRRWLRWLLGALLLFLLLFAGVLFWLSQLALPNPHPLLQSTLVYGSNGQLIGQFSEQNRVDVPLDRVPPVVIDAVVSTEDRHFFSEGAINPVSTARAFVADITGSGGLQGGSTITQQYVKQAYLSSKRSLLRKIEEAAIAYRLAQKQSKRQILDEYLNTIYWGRGAYGVEAASEAYFGKDVSRLGLPEAALLAGLIREPELADPAHNPTVARRNQGETLKAMVRDKKITRAQANSALALPYSRYVIPPNQSTAVREQSGEGYFLDAVRAQLYQKYGRQLVDGGGLRVTTTLDPSMQTEAYNRVYGRSPGALNPAGGDPSAAVVTMDDQGRVLALVGGQNYLKSSVDLALGRAGGGSGRQAGSTFKAFMLAEVIKEGYSVLSVLPAPPRVVIPNGNADGSAWNVTNYAGEAVAPNMNLVDATAYSVNTVFAQVVARIGATKLDAMAEAMGISKDELRKAYLSQVLGSADVSPLEMASAYATLAAGGVYHSPLLITKVTKADGSRLPLPVAPHSKTVLSPSQAAIEDYVLEQVVARGTGVAAGGIGSPMAGKTGTTENSGDAWFIGYTPKLTTALWMGYANSARSMDGFRGLASVTGGTIPAQLWHSYMSQAILTHPQYAGAFPPVPSLAGKMLTAQAPAPQSTTTSATTTAPAPTTAPRSATTSPPPTTAAPRSAPVTAPVPPPTTAYSPPTTTPPATTTTTTTTTTPPGG
jgi:penicillin-binding protein 1A